MVVVIEEPGIEIALVQGCLNGFQVHSGFFYLITFLRSPERSEGALPQDKLPPGVHTMLRDALVPSARAT
jgi:hypothetical protein